MMGVCLKIWFVNEMVCARRVCEMKVFQRKKRLLLYQQKKFVKKMVC